MSKPEISIRPEDPRHADVRRLFAESGAYLQALYPSAYVRPQRSSRNRVGSTFASALKDAARERQISRISLETGIRQPEAIGLYRASGYQDCPPFGAYTPDPLSLFMTTRLQP